MVHDAAWYHSSGGQERIGPVSWAEVEEAWRSGAIGPASLLWASHLPGWVPASTLLGPLGTAPAPPPPPTPGTPSLPPGARASFHCGLWALLTAFLCFPVALGLAIAAIVQNRKAVGMAREAPGRYARPGNAGMVMGILALAVLPLLVIIGIVSAIAIPAMLSQRSRARDRACVGNLASRMSNLVGEYERLSEQKPPPEAIVKGLETHLRNAAGTDRNPWNLQEPAYTYTIEVVNGIPWESARETARNRAVETGRCVYVIQFPAAPQPGFLSGAVRIKGEVEGSGIVARATPLD